ncbi:hypothetical protein AZI86_12560 [Bdellovibrio bacteriovorus]|uniref:DUF4423 domain-containing protein n=1 Tax=Bdellovibrio bacteriovorus TaxID=959 RepID=A0A150WIX0_BDEBC|nr:TIGR02147 family protein [Bdellovibrio bacteriovorus]KYG63656.1 hypothetical protein AZI86_12560 [Bdellovibrio bacteriovorus]
MSNYIELLKNEYQARKSQNKAYSERAFARQLGLSASFLKMLFQGQRHLSKIRAASVLKRLPWDEERKNQFLSSVYELTSQTQKRPRGKAILNMEKWSELPWYYFAIVEAFKLHGGNRAPREVQNSLEISDQDFHTALEQLTLLGLLKAHDRGSYTPAKNYEVDPALGPALESYHQQLLDRANKALQTTPAYSRDFRGVTLAFNKSRTVEAKAFIKRFHEAFEDHFRSDEADAVYQLSTSFFRMDKK